MDSPISPFMLHLSINFKSLPINQIELCRHKNGNQFMREYTLCGSLPTEQLNANTSSHMASFFFQLKYSIVEICV